jgi:deazaflavin-dependent oxidoreductase (nitroreductase family)
VTATTDRGVRTPPRVFVRSFWLLHRTLVRVTGGRFGLPVPTAGARFGMLRLTTVGRRSGRTRVAIVGYFSDGPDLVTLAMNGWADRDPAWWLNLQADPDATVDTGDGPRPVRARAAIGVERERLWATVSDYPGWGDDVAALAGRRPGETTVVILEPRPDGGEESS